mgnify:CR=1 FL=1|tara:strand:- start:3342 stop:3542 length:201 start_codon:yes stop_codon:yes gene_type:complete
MLLNELEMKNLVNHWDKIRSILLRGASIVETAEKTGSETAQVRSILKNFTCEENKLREINRVQAEK